MILYVNGDSHSAGYGIVTNDCYNGNYETPSPANLKLSYGNHIAEHFGTDFVCQARGGGSVSRSIRTTKDFVIQSSGSKLFVILGVPSIEREERRHLDCWYQYNASGCETLPVDLEDDYKDWIVNHRSDYYNKQLSTHQKLVDFHYWLNKQHIPHLFFNTQQAYESDNNTRFTEIDWKGSFFHPYGPSWHEYIFAVWLKNNGFYSDDWGHFGEDGHRAWAKLLIKHIEENDLIR